jgi:hypothetical protein
MNSSSGLRCMATVAALFSAIAAAPLGIYAAVSDEASELIARRAVCDLINKKYAGGQQQAPEMLRAIRFGDLEDRLQQFQADAAPGEIGRALDLPEPLFLYRVTGEGTFLLPQAKIGAGDIPKVTVITSDGVQEWIVAVSRSTGDAFGLYGFEMTGESEPIASFNRLVARFHVAVIDKRTAEELATIFYLTVADPRGRNLVTNRLALKLRAQEYAYGKYGEATANRLFSEWWKQFDSDPARSHVGITVSRNHDQYQVELPVFRVSEKRDVAVRGRTVTVSANGTCRFESEKILFQYPMQIRRSN